MRRNSMSALAILIISVVMVQLTACASGPGNKTPGGQSPVTASASSVSSQMPIVVPLRHAPTGMVMLTWNKEAQVLQINVQMTGLAPKSQHPAHLHQGSCAQGGSLVDPLLPLVADASGNATEITALPDSKGIPQNQIFVNIHNGPDLSSTLQDRAVACGDVTSVQTLANGNQSAQVTLGATTSDDEHAAGQATLSFAGGKLHVVVHLSGLVPGSQHLAHIHTGTCEKQGPVAYALSPVMVDGHGNGTSETTLSLASLPSGPFYVNVHEAARMTGPDSMSTQQGFNPIACGNVQLNQL